MELADGDYVIMHSFSSIVHYSHHSTGSLDTGALDLEGTSAHPRAVMRGFAELDKVETGECSLFNILPELNINVHTYVHLGSILATRTQLYFFLAISRPLLL